MFDMAKLDFSFRASGKRTVLTSSSTAAVEPNAMSELNSERVRLLERSISIDRSWNNAELEDANSELALDTFPVDRL